MTVRFLLCFSASFICKKVYLFVNSTTSCLSLWERCPAGAERVKKPSQSADADSSPIGRAKSPKAIQYCKKVPAHTSRYFLCKFAAAGTNRVSPTVLRLPMAFQTRIARGGIPAKIPAPKSRYFLCGFTTAAANRADHPMVMDNSSANSHAIVSRHMPA